MENEKVFKQSRDNILLTLIGIILFGGTAIFLFITNNKINQEYYFLAPFLIFLMLALIIYGLRTNKTIKITDQYIQIKRINTQKIIKWVEIESMFILSVTNVCLNLKNGSRYYLNDMDYPAQNELIEELKARVAISTEPFYNKIDPLKIKKASYIILPISIILTFICFYFYRDLFLLIKGLIL